MSFGKFVADVLEAHGQTTVWLEQQTGIRRSTISHWKTADATPRPHSVRKIASLFEKQFQIDPDEVYRAANYVMVPSADNDERLARLAAAAAATPEVARLIDRILAMSPEAQEEIIRFVDGWIVATRRQQSKPKPR